MQCVTPMIRSYSIYDSSDQRILPRTYVAKQLMKNPNWIREQVEESNRISEQKGSKWRVQLIPCKHCYACQLNYSSEWATRCMLEAQEHKHNYFITLTYDDEHLPVQETITDPKSGKKYQNDGTWSGSLEPEHVKQFLNSLRKYFERKGIKGIKYFYCGEYGEKTQRPHYHMLLFGAPLDITQFYDCHIDEINKKDHWKSKELEHFWKRGMIDIGELEWSSAAYTARYCMKKLFQKDKSEYYKIGKKPEFVRMSRRPGIGMKYFEDHTIDLYENDELIMRTVKGNVGRYKPPKAFDNKFKDLYPEEWERIKANRQNAADRGRYSKERLTDMSDSEMLQNSYEKVLTKANMLPREL